MYICIYVEKKYMRVFNRGFKSRQQNQNNISLNEKRMKKKKHSFSFHSFYNRLIFFI